MYPLGHVGIPVALALLASRWWRPLEGLDHRVLVVGLLLPDLVDKVLLLVLAGPAVSKGPGHMVLLPLLIGGLAWSLRDDARFLGGGLWDRPAEVGRRGVGGLAVLAGGALAHQILDRPWTYLASWLWPLLGGEALVRYAPGEVPLYAESLWYVGGEVVGLVALLWVAWASRVLVDGDRRRAFLRWGRLRA